MSGDEERDDEATREDRMRAAEEALDAARAAYESARESAHRARHEARAAARDAARAVRHERREERHRMRATWDMSGLNVDLGPLADLGGDEHTEDLERTLTVQGMPRLRVRNVSGETRLHVGEDGIVRIRARKRVRTTSAEKAKRLLENVEVRIDQDGDEIEVKPHLYEQDRTWLDLFRGGRVAVDLDIAVPRETRVEAQTVSGELGLTGTRGPVEIQSVSGDVSVEDVRGPLWLKSVSGDASCVDCVGALEANSVSGDLTLQRCRLNDVDVVTVSGDVALDGDITGSSRFKTISGDVELGLLGRSFDVSYKTTSGDVSCSIEPATVTKEGRRDHRVLIGDGAQRVQVKTVSGDLTLRPAGEDAPAAEPVAADRADAEPAPRPAEAARAAPDARSILDQLARGELSVEDAAVALDAAREAR